MGVTANRVFNRSRKVRISRISRSLSDASLSSLGDSISGPVLDSGSSTDSSGMSTGIGFSRVDFLAPVCATAFPSFLGGICWAAQTSKARFVFICRSVSEGKIEKNKRERDGFVFVNRSTARKEGSELRIV